MKSCFEIYKGFESYVYYVGDRRLSSGKADDDAPATIRGPLDGTARPGTVLVLARPQDRTRRGRDTRSNDNNTFIRGKSSNHLSIRCNS